MKKMATVLLIIAVTGCFTACYKVSYNGQTGKILHKKYDPALNISYSYADSVPTWDTLCIDLDQDNETDLKVYFDYDISYIQAMKDWQICMLSSDNLDITSSCWWERGIHVFSDSYHPIAVAHSTEKGVCYGWLDAYSFVGSDGQHNVIRFYLRETAYCTCVDYPLKWGEE